MRKARATPLLLAALLVTGSAHAADGEPVMVRLDVDASPDCTTREELAARITGRSRRIRLSDDAPVAVRATVSRMPRGSTVKGELVVTRPHAPTTSRHLVAPSCDQANDALALVVVLALDPDAVTAAPPPLVASRPLAPAPTAAPVGAAPEVSAHPPVLPAAPPAAAVPSAGATTAAPTGTAPPVITYRATAAATATLPVSHTADIAHPASGRTTWDVEGGAELIAGPAPGAMAAVRVGARVTRDRSSVWSPSLALAIVHGRTAGIAEPGGTATFTFDGGSLDACPVRLSHGVLEGHACASVLMGRLDAAGSNTYLPAASQRRFGAGGIATVFSAHLTSSVTAGARLQAGGSWIRDAYAFSPTIFHRAAAVTLEGGLWIGVRVK